MKSGRKLGNVKLIRIEELSTQGWFPNYTGTAYYKIKGKRKKVDFVAGQDLPYLIAYLDCGNKTEISKEEQDNTNLLQLIYGEMSYLWGIWELTT